MELLTNYGDGFMSMTKIEDVNDKVVISTAHFQKNFNIGSDKKSFNKKDVFDKNQFIINSVLREC